MVRIAICGERPDYLRDINRLVCKYLDDNGISKEIHIFTFDEELLMTEDIFDILFLDIGVNDLKIMEAAEKLRKQNRKTTIVFISNNSKNWGKAFRLHAFDFIKKPVTELKINKVLEDYIFLIGETQGRKVSFMSGKGIVLQDINEIMYFYYQSKKQIKLKTLLEEYVIKENLHDIYNKLDDKFYMPHKCCIINIKCVKEMRDYEIIMINGDKIPLAQKKKKEFYMKVHSILNNESKPDTVQ